MIFHKHKRNTKLFIFDIENIEYLCFKMKSEINNIPSKKLDRIKLSGIFPAVMFWDVNMEKLSVKKDKNFIISRVLARFMNNDDYLKKLESIYSISEIKRIAMKSNEIFGNEIIEHLSKRYKLSPYDFKKYIDYSQYA